MLALGRVSKGLKLLAAVVLFGALRTTYSLTLFSLEPSLRYERSVLRVRSCRACRIVVVARLCLDLSFVGAPHVAV